MDKQLMVYSSDEVLFSNEKENNYLYKQYHGWIPKWECFLNGVRQKEYMLYDSIYMKL